MATGAAHEARKQGLEGSPTEQPCLPARGVASHPPEAWPLHARTLRLAPDTRASRGYNDGSKGTATEASCCSP